MRPLLFLLLSLFPYTSLAARLDTTGCDSTLRAIALRVDSLLRDSLLERTQVGLCVYDLTAGRPLVRHGECQRMRPASTEKLVTAIAALSLLGTDYEYETPLYTSVPLSKGDSVLRGDLCVVAGYDPLLGHEDMRRYAAALSELGVRRIEGGIRLDLSMKDSREWGWGWCWDDRERPLYPLPFAGEGTDFATALAEALGDAGITFADTLGRPLTAPFTHEGPLPEGACLVTTVTHNLDQALLPMMKDSDNHVAESMFYQIGAHLGIGPATRKSCARPILHLIEQLGFDPDEYEIADGSGLSLYNYLSPELLVGFLRHAYSDTGIFRHLHPSLPVAGTDGTLRRRMQGTGAADNVCAKTGTVTGVSALAGYCTAANGHRLAFSIMNQGQNRAATARAFQDRICRALTE